MLKKLFKHDMKELSRWGLIMTVIVVITSVIGALALYTVTNALSDSIGNPYVASIVDIVSAIALFTSFLALAAYMFGTIFVILRRYYTNFFTDEGYLTFTLPCKKSSLLLSKFFASVIWEFIAVIVLFVCIFIIMLGAPVEVDWNDLSFELSQFRNFISFGSLILLIIEYFVLLAVSSMTGILLMFLAITIGATVAKKHKIIASIGFYYLITSVFSLFSSVATFIPMISVSIRMENTAVEVTSNTMLEMMLPIFGVQILVYAGLGVALFFINHSFLKNKLNLS